MGRLQDRSGEGRGMRLATEKDVGVSRSPHHTVRNSMQLRSLLILLAIVVIGLPARAATEAERRDHLAWMLKELPDAPAWREWQQKTGALPPDFDALPSANYLPDPFRFHDGRAVNMPADWAARRAEMQ